MTDLSRKTLQAKRRHARLLFRDGLSTDEVARRLDVSPKTAWKWRQLITGDAQLGHARLGRPPSLSEQQEREIRWALAAPPPPGFGLKWTTAKLACFIQHVRTRDQREAGRSKNQISISRGQAANLLKKFGYSFSKQPGAAGGWRRASVRSSGDQASRRTARKP